MGLYIFFICVLLYSSRTVLVCFMFSVYVYRVAFWSNIRTNKLRADGQMLLGGPGA